MKKYLLAVLLLAGLNAKTQNFNPHTQGIYFKTDAISAMEYLKKYSKYKDSSITSILALKKIPFLQWSITSKSVYLRKEGEEAKKIGRVLKVEVKDYPSLAIEYTYFLKEATIKIYYKKDQQEFIMIDFNGTLYSIDEQPKID